jgi:succinate-semialdehyde dehydrogenase/glutarate-semialdehyde dehydrogenase
MESRNPATDEEIRDYEEHTWEQVEGHIRRANDCFIEWRRTSFKERAERMRTAAKLLRELGHG